MVSLEYKRKKMRWQAKEWVR